MSRSVLKEGTPFLGMMLRSSSSVALLEYAFALPWKCICEGWGWAKQKSQAPPAHKGNNSPASSGGNGGSGKWFAIPTHLEQGDRRVLPPLVSCVQGAKGLTTPLSLGSGVHS